MLLCLVTSFLFQSAWSQGYKTNNDLKKNREEKEDVRLGKNILAVSPIQILLTNADQSDPDLAVNISYERILNNPHLSFRVPVCLSLMSNYFYLLPTVKAYPFKQGPVKYAVGPQFLVGFGDFNDNRYVYNPQSGQNVQLDTTFNRKQFGFLINNSLNITLMKSLYVGLDASIGIIYYDNLPKNYYNNYGLTPLSTGNSNVGPAFQLHFNIGYRF